MLCFNVNPKVRFSFGFGNTQFCNSEKVKSEPGDEFELLTILLRPRKPWVTNLNDVTLQRILQCKNLLTIFTL